MLPLPDPFLDAPDPALYVPHEASERALDDLLACAESVGRSAALISPPGTGKTLLLHLLVRQLPPPLRAVYVPNPVLSPAELCAWTLGRLGSPRWTDPIAVVSAYAEHRAQAGGALVWLVDDAHSLPERTARWLARMVAASEGALRLVFAAIDDRAEALRAFEPFVRIDALARALGPDEVAQFVSARLARVNAASELRARYRAALGEIHAASGGVPREISAACGKLLLEEAGRPATS